MPHVEFFDELGTCRNYWEDLQRRRAPQPFQSYDWVKAWYETIGSAEGADIAIAVVFGRERIPIALYPFSVRYRLFWRILTWSGGRVSDYGGGVFDLEYADELPKFSLVARRAAEHFHCDAAIFSNVPELYFGSRNPVLHSDFRPERHRSHRMTVPESLEGYLRSRFSSKARYNLRRNEKLLSELGALDYSTAETAADLRLLTDAMIQFKSARYLETGVLNFLQEPHYAAFYHRLNELSPRMTTVSAVTVGGRPVAVHWGVQWEDTLYYLMPSYEATTKKYSPGTLLTMKIIADAISQGTKYIDFTIGDEDYKRLWCNESSALYHWELSISSKGRVLVVVNRCLDVFLRSPLLRLAKSIRARYRSARKRG